MSIQARGGPNLLFTYNQTQVVNNRPRISVDSVFQVFWQLKQLVSLHTVVAFLTFHGGRVLKVSRARALIIKPQLHLAFLAATAYLSGETFLSQVRPEIIKATIKKYEAKTNFN